MMKLITLLVNNLFILLCIHLKIRILQYCYLDIKLCSDKTKKSGIEQQFRNKILLFEKIFFLVLLIYFWQIILVPFS